MPFGTINVDSVVNSDGVTSGGAYGFKNRIINGAMVIDQRNAGASVNVISEIFTLDRWAFAASQTGKLTCQQNAGSVTPPAGFKNYLGITSASSYSVLTGDIFALKQNIEGFNTADLGFGAAGASTVTLSFWVRSSLTGTFGASLVNSAFDRSFVFSYTISSANTWEYKTVTVAGDTSGTWIGATNGIGLRIYFNLGCGSTFVGTANTWSAGGFVAPSGSTSVVGTNGATFYITGVQLEKGSTATSFDYRPFGTELQLCQRYYQTYGIGNGVGSNTQRLISAANNSGNAICTWSFIQTMRAAPTATLYGSNSTTGNVGVNYAASQQTLAANTAVTFSNTSVNGWMFNLGSTITANIVNWIDMGTQGTGGAFTFSAEL